ncbi:hypothetical protein G7Y89_g4594 [Cudoniella acicularis]|uniref:Protein kinase domain-containing protein n=1 Tax=Cudoniella acicularis TaxID=354080 RepID=A0A8H4W6J2_9HELO|nr:hypothetical protein G7Y89_g4594 [Cudoniella acicularis]
MDSIDETAPSLASRTNRCITRFSELSLLEARQQEFWAENQSARFLLWSANLGVFAEGHASTDHRLEKHPEVARVLTQLLKSLEANLNHLIELWQNKFLPLALTSVLESDHEDGDEDGDKGSSSDSNASALTVPSLPSRKEVCVREEFDTSPASEARERVEVTIRRLNTITTSIRRAGTKNRDSKANAWIERDKDGQDLTSYFAHLAKLAIDFKFPDATPTIRHRLAQSLSQRRNRIAYARKHQRKLAKVRTEKLVSTPALLISDRKVSLAAPSLVSISKPSYARAATETSATSATQADNGHIPLPTFSAKASSRAASVISGDSFKARDLIIPDAPDVTGKDDFKCPYCMDMYPAKEALGDRWRRHLMKDLRPYVCTFETCERLSETFRTFDEWILHMRQDHPSTQWVCAAPMHGPQAFDSEVLYKEHMLTKHGGTFSLDELPELIRLSLRSTFQVFTECPFCDFFPEEAKKTNSTVLSNKAQDNLQRHVASHLEELSLLSLRWVNEEKDDDSVEDSSIRRRAEMLHKLEDRPTFDDPPVSGLVLETYLDEDWKGASPIPDKVIDDKAWVDRFYSDNNLIRAPPLSEEWGFRWKNNIPPYEGHDKDPNLGFFLKRYLELRGDKSYETPQMTTVRPTTPTNLEDRAFSSEERPSLNRPTLSRRSAHPIETISSLRAVEQRPTSFAPVGWLRKQVTRAFQPNKADNAKVSAQQSTEFAVVKTSNQPSSSSGKDLQQTDQEMHFYNSNVPGIASNDEELPSLNNLVDNTSQSNQKLEDQLWDARIEWPRGQNRYFIPAGTLTRLLTSETIIFELAKALNRSKMDLHELAEKILTKALRLFAILVCIDMTSSILDFLNEDLGDDDLPFMRYDLIRWPGGTSNFTLCSSRIPNRPLKCLSSWGRMSIENFSRDQWWMLAPIFKQSRKVRHYELEDNCVLPYIEDREGSDGAEEGGYSTVWAVRIHPEHQFMYQSIHDSNPLLAIKRLNSKKDGDFEMEVEMLKAFSRHRQPHLIKLLATYRYRGRHFLIFPFANANLRGYWAMTPIPDFSTVSMTWMLRQCHGISSGLMAIHEYRTSLPGEGVDSSANPREGLYGRHGDIKPENILWSKDWPKDDSAPNDKLGTLAIADFGLMEFHKKQTRSWVLTETMRGSLTYEPPERKMRQNVSRAYDIWSLGCVFLEFITWIVCGDEKIQGFSDARGQTDSGGLINDDAFYTVRNEGPARQAFVRESVREWIQNLHTRPRCTQFVHDFLDIISKSMLVVDPNERIRIGPLVLEFSRMQHRATVDSSYLIEPRPFTQLLKNVGRISPDLEHVILPSPAPKALPIPSFYPKSVPDSPSVRGLKPRKGVIFSWSEPIAKSSCGINFGEQI